jgi:hypothetical protein
LRAFGRRRGTTRDRLRPLHADDGATVKRDRLPGRRSRPAIVAAALLTALGTATLLVGLTGLASAAATVTVTPSTGLTNNQTVTVTGSGFAAKSTGDILQCNGDPNQPTVLLPSPISTAIPVSCTPPSVSALVNTDQNGGLNTTYQVISGTVGPPCGTPTALITTCPATDSAGNNPVTDAANYPCPPTAAEAASGIHCYLTYGDASGDTSQADVDFASSAPSTTTTTTAAPSVVNTSQTTVSTAPTVATTAPTAATALTGAAQNLAFTGNGGGVRWVTVIGVLLTLGGLVGLSVVDAPRLAMVKLGWVSAGGSDRRRRGAEEARVGAVARVPAVAHVPAAARVPAVARVAEEEVPLWADSPYGAGSTYKGVVDWPTEPQLPRATRLFIGLTAGEETPRLR